METKPTTMTTNKINKQTLTKRRSFPRPNITAAPPFTKGVPDMSAPWGMVRHRLKFQVRPVGGFYKKEGDGSESDYTSRH